MSTETEAEVDPVRWTGFGSFAFVVYLVVGCAYGLTQTAYVLVHDGLGSAAYSAVELPLVLAVLLGLLAAQRTPAGSRPPLFELALGTAGGYLAYLGVLAAVALPAFDLVALVRTPLANAIAGAGIVTTAVIVAWAAHRFEFADERGSVDGYRRR